MNSIESTILDLLKEYVDDFSVVNGESSLMDDLSLDSLKIIHLLLACEKEFEGSLFSKLERLEDISTVDKLVAFISTVGGEG